MQTKLMAHPKVWIMRAGAHGEDEPIALSQGLAVIGFRHAGDLVKYQSMEEIAAVLLKADKSPSRDRANTLARQLWAFSRLAREGDTVALPLKTQSGQIALGTLVGPYVYKKIGNEMRHTRKMRWLKDVPRTSFQQDLLHSFGAFLTVCRVSRHDAERRVAAVMDGKVDPGLPDAEQGSSRPHA